jgi:hypothetical protein
LLRGDEATGFKQDDLLIVAHGNLDTAKLRVARVPGLEPATFAYGVDHVGMQLAPLSTTEPLPLLFLALLAAATTRPWARDELTCETGAETAVRTLFSERCWSNAPRTPAERSVLAQIRALAPARDYYPSHLRVMETVQWSPVHAVPELDVLALRVDELLAEAARVAFLFPGGVTEFESGEAEVILRRDALTRARSHFARSSSGRVYDEWRPGRVVVGALPVPRASTRFAVLRSWAMAAAGRTPLAKLTAAARSVDV